jgi:hypothetical protein
MRDYKVLEELIASALEHYKQIFNALNENYEVDFNATLTNHQVEVQHVKHWVAYLRLEKAVRPKGGSDDDWENTLVYNQAYKFRDVGEQTDPNAPWKFDLYLDMFFRLVGAGVEYGELLKRMQAMYKGKEGKPLSEITTPDEPKIIVTDQMPKPLSDDEKAYAEWVKKNKS